MKQSAQSYAATADVATVGAGPIGLEMDAIAGHWPNKNGTIESCRDHLPLAQIEAN